MKKIVIIGAGRSATTLINYLLNLSQEFDWQIHVCDFNLQLAEEKINGHSRGTAHRLDIMNEEARRQIIRDADIVVSMLPPTLHLHLAKDCLLLRKNLVNASYVSPEMAALNQEVTSSGLLFLCEMGLDPGIDHMSAMQILDDIRDKGGKVTHFKSYTGGLVAPESDDNPWHYKFSWSPRNVVVAGQGTAQYIEQGQLRFVPYHRIFNQIRSIQVPEMGPYEVYANRDSLSYMEKYGLEEVETLYRGTVRRVGFCSAWNALIKIGLTDSHFVLPNKHNLSYRSFLECLCPEGKGTLEERICHLTGIELQGPEMSRLKWLGIFDDARIPVDLSSPADILEQILLEKWKLRDEDKDMIIMQHDIDYEYEGQSHQIISTLVEIGQDSTNTAMSRLVGLPMAVFVKHFLTEGCSLRGVQIPVSKEIYEPVLKELSTLGVRFKEYELTN